MVFEKRLKTEIEIKGKCIEPIWIILDFDTIVMMKPFE